MRRLSAAALLSVALAGCGGTEVQGFVRDEGTGEPLRGAKVQAGDEVVQTDASGLYEIEIDDPASTRFEIEAPGYEPKVMTMTIDEERGVASDVHLTKESQERQQTRQQLDEAETMLEEAEQKVEDAERQVYEARRDFEQNRGTAGQTGGAWTPEQPIDQPIERSNEQR